MITHGGFELDYVLLAALDLDEAARELEVRHGLPVSIEGDESGLRMVVLRGESGEIVLRER